MKHSRNNSIAASAIIRHVCGGGYLGAAWPQYVKGLPRVFSPRKAMELAQVRAWWIDRLSDHNFMEVTDEVQ